jgi:hypothetical protein
MPSPGEHTRCRTTVNLPTDVCTYAGERLQVVQTRLDGDVAVHPSSINFNCGHFAHPFLLFHEKVLSSKVRPSRLGSSCER